VAKNAMNKLEKREGFTIIEVVLVLAIAGLIFLIVFLAVPALQRSQRDTQRRNDVSRFMAQIQNYSANNKGCIPAVSTGGCPATTLATFVSSYLDNGSGVPDNWKDPTTGDVYAVKATDVTSTDAAGTYYYASASKCNGESIEAVAGGTRKAAVRMKLEGAGFLCQNN
jgi:prepilin-type N-terminal cleavage/methylation domain-containing protein